MRVVSNKLRAELRVLAAAGSTAVEQLWLTNVLLSSIAVLMCMHDALSYTIAMRYCVVLIKRFEKLV
jgi:hypothetical protein